MPGLGLTQHVGDLSQLAAEPPAQLRLLLGYAGWGAGQLVEEILRNDWLTAPAASTWSSPPTPPAVGRRPAPVAVEPGRAAVLDHAGRRR